VKELVGMKVKLHAFLSLAMHADKQSASYLVSYFLKEMGTLQKEGQRHVGYDDKEKILILLSGIKQHVSPQ
jgi:hypothetical protein